MSWARDTCSPSKLILCSNCSNHFRRRCVRRGRDGEQPEGSRGCGDVFGRDAQDTPLFRRGIFRIDDVATEKEVTLRRESQLLIDRAGSEPTSNDDGIRGHITRIYVLGSGISVKYKGPREPQ